MRLLICIACLAAACTPTEHVDCQPPENEVEAFKKSRFERPTDPSQPQGILISSIIKPSFAGCLGIQDGDRVIEFNGRAIREVGDYADFILQFVKDEPLHLLLEDASGRRRKIVNVPPAA